MITINLLFSLPPIPCPCLWKEGKPMSGQKPDKSSDFVTRKEFSKKPAAAPEYSSEPVGQNFLPLEWVLNPDKGEGLSERILARLLLAEAKSGDHDHKLAYRLAWHIVLHCMKGDAHECSPVTLAYYSVVGCHEEQYYDRVMIRRAAMFGDANRIPFPARKKKSVSIQPKKEESA